MPHIEPFRALVYAPRLRGSLDRLVAPPYDVLSEEQRARLAERHEYNVVHVDLPRPEVGEEPYAAAARRLERWVADAVVTRDDRPAFYACEQRYLGPSGSPAARRGFFARMRLETFGTGSVIPHERTLDRPRADRQRLLAATRTHLSASFLLHPDPAGEVARLVGAALEGEPFEQARDDDGTLSRVVRVDDADRLEFLAARLRDHWALIADGHHRYESALAYRDERRAAGRNDAEHVLVYLVSLQDPGLAIFPIHRLVHSLPDFDAARFCGRLAQAFRLAPAGTGEGLSQAVAARADRPGVLGVALADGSFLLAEWKEGEVLTGPEMESTPAALRRLDVVLLHRLVLEGMLGITPEAQGRQANLDYVKDERELFLRVAQGSAQIGILMNPTRIDQVIEVTRSGHRLPQKSTYFYPKVLSGLVFDRLD
ncbi:MAG TPA: DUF1015 domain-containing protein [Candidatus Dormibacteraeota bacterium]|nr:DUF1015 domain-containing protein [Candidatus Dormibacteraeota bacterium]